mgnify:CR=1 FL=1
MDDGGGAAGGGDDRPARPACASTGARRSRRRCCGSRCWRAGTRTRASATLLCLALGAVAAVDVVGQPAAAGARAAMRSSPRRPRLPRTASRATPGACSSAASAPRTTTCRPTTCRSRRTTWSRTAPRPPTSACTCWPPRARASFGWIGSVETDRTASRRRSATLATLPRHRGHFLNWYDTRARRRRCCRSTRLHGRQRQLCARTCSRSRRRAWSSAASRRDDGARCARALAASATRIAAAARAPSERAAAGGDALADLLDDASTARADQPPTRRASSGSTAPPPSSRDAPTAARRVDADAGARDSPGLLERPRCRPCARRCATPRAARRRDAAARLQRIAATCRAARRASPTSPSSYHRKRRLFHIGFRVAEHQLDAGFYDLLASEARADQPVGRSPRATCPPQPLGRARPPVLTPSARCAGLRSWSGSMFEYLMPTLVLDEPHGSVAAQRRAARRVREQIAYAPRASRALGHLGVGVRRQRPHPGLPVRAAGRAASGAAPHAERRAGRRAVRHRARRAGRAAPRASPTSRRLEQVGRAAATASSKRSTTRPARQSGSRRRRPASSTFMAHHQGMSIVAARQRPARRAPRAAGAWAIRASRRWPRCCTSARRARCRVLREPPAEPAAERCAAKRVARHAARGAAGHDGDRADPPAVERPLRASPCAPTAPARSRWRQPRHHALARRRAARRLRQLLPPALGPPAARRSR